MTLAASDVVESEIDDDSIAGAAFSGLAESTAFGSFERQPSCASKIAITPVIAFIKSRLGITSTK
jgi:hypothetical protein